MVRVSPVAAGAAPAALLAATDPEGLKPVIDVLTQTRQSLTLRSLLLTGFPHDPEFFAAGLALGREWSRRGLKIAVVDLDYRHPTVVRHKPHPNEGYVDVLEYGCSYRRVAWELVADSLWLVGPGSHPPDEERLAEHPDWDRAVRVFSNQVDVTLYMAPFLDRSGLTGRLSKRMDGVLLVASVERVGRSALRDAFLELWGSDAPMIGSVGIDARSSATSSAPSKAQEGREAPPRPETRAAGEAPLAPAAPAITTARQAPAAPPAAPAASAPSVASPWVAPGGPAPLAPEPSWDREPSAGERQEDEALAVRLAEEIRTGNAPRTHRRPGSRAALFAGVSVAVAAAIGIAGVVVKTSKSSNRPAPQETLPAGTEEVIPAQLGGPSPSVLPRDGATRDTIAGSPKSPDNGSAPYRVHIASFRSVPKVRDLVSSLKARGLDAWYEPATNGPGWYRVFVGHYATHAEAAQRAEWLLDRGWVDRAIAYPDTER